MTNFESDNNDKISLSFIRKQIGKINYSNPKLVHLICRIDIGSGFRFDDLAEELTDVTNFLGQGAFRAVFDTTKSGWVVKLPKSTEGAEQNILESARFDLLEPYNLAPKHRLVWVNDIPVLYVEKLTKMDSDNDSNHKDTPELSLIKAKLGLRDWMQTGVTIRGNRVFSDIGH